VAPTAFQTAGSTSNTSSAGAAIGAYWDGTNLSNVINGDIYAVLVWARVLSAAERNRAERYLGQQLDGGNE
jgi:hypothetical protein